MFTIESYHADDDLLTPMHNVDFSYHAHLHRCLEFSFCMRGKVTLTVAGQQVPLHENEGVMIPQNIVHSYAAESSCEYYTFLCGRNILPDFANLFTLHAPQRYSFAMNPLLKEQVKGFFDSRERTIFAAKALLYHAGDVFLHGNALVERDRSADEVAIRMLEYLQQHFRENLTLEDFAGRIDYSYCYISKLIKKNFGVPFTELLAEYRIAYAQTLLDEHTRSITEIALSSGFGSIRNFNRVFRQITGLTPSEYLHRAENTPAKSHKI